MTLAPSQGRNHNFPSGVLATCGWKWPGLERLLTPSELSKTEARIIRVAFCFISASAAQASSSERAIRTSPQAVYSQNERSSSSIDQCTVSHGNPFLLLSVARRLFLSRLSPPSVETHSVPSSSNRKSLTRPAPSPSAAV